MRIGRITISIILLFVAVGAAGQSLDEEQLLARLGTDEATMERVRALNLEALSFARIAGAEQRILQARLEKLLLEPDPDMHRVEALLRESLEWKLKVEMQNIERNQQIRSILGEEEWLRMLKFRREIRERLESRTGGLPAGNTPLERRDSRSTRSSDSDSAAGTGSGRK